MPSAVPSAAPSNVPGLVSVSSPPLVQVLEDSTIQGATIPADDMGNCVVKKKSHHRLSKKHTVEERVWYRLSLGQESARGLTRE